MIGHKRSAELRSVELPTAIEFALRSSDRVIEKAVEMGASAVISEREAAAKVPVVVVLLSCSVASSIRAAANLARSGC